MGGMCLVSVADDLYELVDVLLGHIYLFGEKED